MPDKPFTVFTYAASASLAAVALVYLFHPNYLLDGDSSTATASTRKKGVVGLFNPANDCFINCILQSLAGLGDLRVYLIRELHRRELVGENVYGSLPLKDANGKEINGKKLLSLQNAEVTKGLKEMTDKLNERPIYKKTISAAGFIAVLERAFGTTISKTQQDAQELLQVVAERLSEEYHAGKEARKRSRELTRMEVGVKRNETTDSSGNLNEGAKGLNTRTAGTLPATDGATSNMKSTEQEGITEDEDGFPLEGRTEARTQCQFCRFVPKASPTSFVMLNLMVPQRSSSSLNECFDAHFKTEYIDDYKCDKCRLAHAIENYTAALHRAELPEAQAKISSIIDELRRAISEDPEKPPEHVHLPDIKFAPKRKIERHIEITTFPKVLVIHLSRSIYDPQSSSMKNMAKVTFPERFPVGPILNRRNYKLLGVVTHKGTHNSGHYETFRKQHFYAPYSNPHSDKHAGPYSVTSTPRLSEKPSPSIQPISRTAESTAPTDTASIAAGQNSDSTCPSSPRTSDSRSVPSTRPSSGSQDVASPQKEIDLPAVEEPCLSMNGSLRAPTEQPLHQGSSSIPRSKSTSIADISRLKRRKRPADRWWRISDDKVKECKTSDVLDMKKEVYMLFYEIEKSGDSG